MKITKKTAKKNNEFLLAVTEVRSDAFALMLKHIIEVYKRYYINSGNQLYADILTDVENGESLLSMKRKYSKLLNIQKESAYIKIRRALRSALSLLEISELSKNVVYLEKQYSILERQYEMLKDKNELLEKYIREKDWEMPDTHVAERNYDEIDFEILSTRLVHALKSDDIEFYSQIIRKGSNIRRFRNIGEKTVAELEQHMKSRGFDVDFTYYKKDKKKTGS
jgi:DNA-directed RNA polymerase alpha subunit